MVSFKNIANETIEFNKDMPVKQTVEYAPRVIPQYSKMRFRKARKVLIDDIVKHFLFDCDLEDGHYETECFRCHLEDPEETGPFWGGNEFTRCSKCKQPEPLRKMFEVAVNRMDLTEETFHKRARWTSLKYDRVHDCYVDGWFAYVEKKSGDIDHEPFAVRIRFREGRE